MSSMPTGSAAIKAVDDGTLSLARPLTNGTGLPSRTVGVVLPWIVYANCTLPVGRTSTADPASPAETPASGIGVGPGGRNAGKTEA